MYLERLQQWLDDYGAQGWEAFNIHPFFFPIIFWSVIVCALIAETR